MNTPSGTSWVAVIDRVHQALESLGLAEVAGVVEARLEHAAQHEQAYGEFLAELLECETVARRERYLRTRMRLAHLALWVGFVALSLATIFAIPFLAVVAVPLIAGHLNALSSGLTLKTWGDPRTRLVLLGSAGGRVLSVDSAQSGGRPAWRVKVVTARGEVRVILVDAASGRTL